MILYLKKNVGRQEGCSPRRGSTREKVVSQHLFISWAANRRPQKDILVLNVFTQVLNISS